MNITHKLDWLNSGNRTSRHQRRCIEALPSEFPNDEIIVLEVGSAYGGGAEVMGKILYGRGKVYGYDTFEGHPKDLADKPTDREAICMDYWYNHPDYGRDKLSYEYQCKILAEEGLDNVILVKGRINEHSFDDIEKVHFALLDMDLIQPTKIAYEALRDKIVKGGYLFLHDAVPKHNLVNLSKYLYDEVIYNKMWEILGEHKRSCVVILRKI